MISTALGRVIWKEFRALWAFWLAIWVFAVLLATYLRVLTIPKGETLIFVGAGAALFYAFGCLAATFAGEREERTDQFLLEMLPIRTVDLIGGKLLFAVGSALALMFAEWLFAALFLSIMPRTQLFELVAVGLVGCVAIAHGVAYGGLFSLVLRQPLVAACLAIGTASLVFNACTGVVGELLGLGPSTFRDLDDIHWPALLGTLVAVLALDAFLARRWMRGETVDVEDALRSVFTVRRAREASVAIKTSGALPASRSRQLGRLVWQGALNARLMFVGSLTLALISSLSLFALRQRNHLRDAAFVIPAFIFMSILVTLMGASAFREDQRGGQFRFFTDRGVSAGLVWLSRQLLWAWPLLLFALFYPPIQTLVVVVRAAARDGLYYPASPFDSVGHMLGLIALMYAGGQFASLLLRSGLLAAVLASAFSLLAVGYCLTMWTLNVPWWWSIAPLVVGLMLATWLRASYWLLERRDFRSWAPMTLAIGVPLLGIAIAFPLYRAYEYPLVDPGFDVAELTRPLTGEELATNELYDEADRIYGNHFANLALKVEGKTPLDLVLEAAKRPQTRLTDLRDVDYDAYAFKLQRLQALAVGVRVQGMLYRRQRELDKSLECLLAALKLLGDLRPRPFANSDQFVYLQQDVFRELIAWSRSPAQTKEKVRDGIARARALLETLPDAEQVVEAVYVRYEQSLGSGEVQTSHKAPQLFEYVWSYLPWERVRALRVLRQATRIELDAARQTQAKVAERRPIHLWPNRYHPDIFFRDTPLLQVGYARESGFQNQQTIKQWLAAKTVGRAGLVLMALAHSSEHGALPDELAALVGVYLADLPADPYTGQSFRYFPKGLTYSLKSWGSPMPISDEERNIPARHAFIWSSGPNVWWESPVQRGETVPDDNPLAQYRLLSMDLTTQLPASEKQLWETGWAFPIEPPPAPAADNSPAEPAAP